MSLTTYVVLDRTQVPADQIARVVAQVASIIDLSADIQAMLDGITAGGTQPTNLETLGVPAGQGANVYGAFHDVINFNLQAINKQILMLMYNGG